MSRGTVPTSSIAKVITTSAKPSLIPCLGAFTLSKSPLLDDWQSKAPTTDRRLKPPDAGVLSIQSMKVATWNVNGIRARQEQVREWVMRERPDVICLQETKASPEQVPADLKELEGYWSYWHGAKGYSGVALLVRNEVCAEPPHFSHPHFDLEHRIVTALIAETTFASVYVPNGGKNFAAKMQFLKALEEYAADFRSTGDSLVICGDLNVAHAEIDVHPKERRNVVCQLPQERAAFDRILAAGLVDVARALDPENVGLFTWWAPWREMRQRNIGWRLDYVLASTGLAKTASSCSAQREVGTSDHAPVVALFQT